MPFYKNEEDYIKNQMGSYDVFFKKSYKILKNLNDFMIGVWFLAGSLCILSPKTEPIGIWFFIIGSAQLIIRPAIQLIHNLHLRSHLKAQYRKQYHENGQLLTE